MSNAAPAALVALAETGITSLGPNATTGTVVRVRERGDQHGQWAGTYANRQDAQTVADRLAAATAGTVHWITDEQIVVTKNGQLARAAQQRDEADTDVRRLAIEAVQRGEQKTLIADLAGITRPTLDRWIANS